MYRPLPTPPVRGMSQQTGDFLFKCAAVVGFIAVVALAVYPLFQ